MLADKRTAPPPSATYRPYDIRSTHSPASMPRQQEAQDRAESFRKEREGKPHPDAEQKSPREVDDRQGEQEDDQQRKGHGE